MFGHDYKTVSFNEPVQPQIVSTHPVYDPDKTAFLNWLANYLAGEKKDLKQLKAALQVGMAHRPDLPPHEAQRYLKSLLFISVLTLYVCCRVIGGILNQLFSAKSKSEFLTQGEIGIMIGCLFAFVYLFSANLKARHHYAEKMLTSNELNIITNHGENDFRFNKLVLLVAAPTLTVSDLIKIIDQQFLPKITTIFSESKKSVNQPDLPLSLEAKAIKRRWLEMPESERLKWYETPLEQTFSQCSFAITRRY